MSVPQNFGISISACGRVTAQFSSVTYTAHVMGTGKTGPLAKEQARPVVDRVNRLISEHAKEAGIDTARLETTMTIDSIVRYDTTNNPLHAGYRASYIIRFEGTNVAAAIKLHEALTSIEGVDARTPVYNVADTPALMKLAFKEGIRLARARFEEQCRSLGLKASDYEVVSWSSAPKQRFEGKTSAMIEDERGTRLEPGQTEYQLNVTLVFARKNDC